MSTLALALAWNKAHPAHRLFPIRRLHKKPPLFKNELELASNDPQKLRQWHNTFIGCNWGIAVKRSGLIVADVDCKPDKCGQETLDHLELEHGPLPETLTVRTPSGGYHFYFNATATVKHKMRVSAFGPGVDSTNYVLLPGCELVDAPDATAGVYEIINDAPVADAPEWFAEYLKEVEQADADQTPAIDLDKPETIERAIYFLTHDARSSILGKNGEYALLMNAAVLKDMGVSEEKAIELLAQYFNVPKGDGNHPYCDPLWSVGDGPKEDRLDVKVRNSRLYLKKVQPGAHSAEAEFGADPLPPETDDEIEVETPRPKRRMSWDRIKRRRRARGFVS